MTRAKPAKIEHVEVFPDCVYRTSLSPALFGLGYDQTRRKILSGDLPAPHRPTPTSKFQVWSGQQILDHREKMQKQAEEALKAQRISPREQPAQLAKVNDRRKKTKLRPPGK